MNPVPTEIAPVVVVTRPVANKHSDLIYVLKERRVVEIGTHEELYDKADTYFELFNASARSLNLDKVAKTLDDEVDQ